MGALLTYGYKRFEDLDVSMRRLIPPLHRLSRSLMPKIDADSFAYSQFMVSTVPQARHWDSVVRKITVNRCWYEWANLIVLGVEGE